MTLEITASQIVRNFVRNRGGMRRYVYSDKIKNGHSIKVCGYTPKDYEPIVSVLENHGFLVKMITNCELRMHVTRT